MKLYRSQKYPNRWFAHSVTTGWVMFPAVADGWSKREPARGMDPMDVREVPIRLAAITGIHAASNASMEDANLEVAA